jgi:DNA processing protein
LQDNSQQGTLTPIEQAIMQCMEREPIHIDTLAVASGIDVSSLLVHLFELELKAAVVQQAGQFFQKKFL